MLHNLAGPAVEDEERDREEWRVDGRLHALYGPSVRVGRSEGWHRHGRRIAPPSPEEQVLMLIRGARVGAVDIQHMRHRGAELLGVSLAQFDAHYARASAELDYEEAERARGRA